MELFVLILDYLLHFDHYLPQVIANYGIWTYLLLFGIIFCETGLVVMPYLPGDSLLFVAGALAGTGLLDPWILIAGLSVAAILGDSVNYWIGNRLGISLLTEKCQLLKKDHLDKTEAYFKKYGGLTIVIARFIPFIRTFAPFLAGVGKMNYPWFLMYNVSGGIAWVAAFVLGGFFFGNIPVVKENFTFVIYAIIAISLFAVGSILFGIVKALLQRHVCFILPKKGDGEP
jgi:membrane-associated protein